MKTIRGGIVLFRADERMQHTINGLSHDGDALPRRAVSVDACGFIQAVTGSAVGRVLATLSGGARRVGTECLTMPKLPVHFSL